jgi:hypothetical protein
MATDTCLPPSENDLTKLHHDQEWYIATPQSIIQKRVNQSILHQRQGRGDKCNASRPSLIKYTPQLNSIAKVGIHCTSIECIDDIDITYSIPQDITFPCPWIKKYEIPPSHIRRIIIPCPTPPQLIQSMHSTSSLRSASDGSILNCIGYQGWLVATLDKEIIIQGVGATDGRVEDTHFYHAKLCGNIATFAILNIIIHIYSSIQHVCNNQSAISVTCKYDTLSVFDRTKPDADVIIVARVALSELQLHFYGKPHWVSSHADKRGPPYTIQEELNILTDKLAERAQTELSLDLRPRHDALRFPEQQIAVVIVQKKVSSRLPLHISNTKHSPLLRTGIMQKEGWTTHVNSSVDGTPSR